MAEPTTEALKLHQRALNYNWDSGVGGLTRILNRPYCDYGTALAIYWMGAPGYYAQYASESEVPSWGRGTYRFLMKVEKRLLSRDFATSEILFNPRYDCTTISDKGHDWTSEYDDNEVKRPIPAELYEPSREDPAFEARGRRAARKNAERLT